jgi:uncharacterized protein
MNTSPSAYPETVPETASPANFALNILRGAAIIGLLFVSIWEFAGFRTNEQTFYLTASHHGGNYRLLTFVSFLFEGKMTALLAMVFGAGIVLFLQKKTHPVVIDGPDAYIRQQIWFMLIGLVLAFIVLWPYDILFPFAVVGILVFAFWKLPAKGLFIAALLCTFIYCGKNYWNYTEDKKNYQKYLAVTAVEKKFKQDSTTRANKFIADSTKDPLNIKTILADKKLSDSLAKKKDTLTSKQAEEKGSWEGTVNSLKYDSSKTVAQNKAMRAGYSKIWFYLKGRAQRIESTWLYSIGVWDIGSGMFLGMALLGIGFFHRRFSKITYFLLAVGLIALGIFLTWYRLHYNNVRLLGYSTFIETHPLPYNFFYPLEQLLLASGYAALVIWLLQIKMLNWLWQSLAAVGRIAFTNYILQTIICAFIFYGYGLGYYGRFKQWELYFIVAEITLVQVVFSVLWLRFYKMGPVEWLLYSLVYRKKLTNKREAAA